MYTCLCIRACIIACLRLCRISYFVKDDAFILPDRRIRHCFELASISKHKAMRITDDTAYTYQSTHAYSKQVYVYYIFYPFDLSNCRCCKMLDYV